MPSDLQFKVANAVHRGLLKLTFGKFGWDLENMPVVELTTTGRKSGQPRTVMLTSPVQDGDTIVVVASARWRRPRIRPGSSTSATTPTSRCRSKGKPKQRMRARRRDTRTSEPACGRRSPSKYKGYGNYQTKTTREIPLVLLEPA